MTAILAFVLRIVWAFIIALIAGFMLKPLTENNHPIMSLIVIGIALVLIFDQSTILTGIIGIIIAIVLSANVSENNERNKQNN